MKEKFIFIYFFIFISFIFAGNSTVENTRVLVASGYFDFMNIPVVKKMEKKGMTVRSISDITKLDIKTAKKYHIIIMAEPVTRKINNTDILSQFLNEGGTVLFFTSGFSKKRVKNLNRYLEKLGASILPEVVIDSQNSYKCPFGFNLTYSYTENIEKGKELTDGVKGIWYSAGEKVGFHTSPLKVSDKWEVLIEGEKTAASFIPSGLNEKGGLKKGTVNSSPVIVAERKYGKGEIILIGISSIEAFYGQGIKAYQGIIEKNGDGLRKSDFGKFFENCLVYLSKIAKKSDGVGKGEIDEWKNPWEHYYVFDWNKDLFGGNLCKVPAKGLIGIHSSLSDGNIEPLKLIKKAKEEGYKWVVFTEKLENFSKEKWEKLRKICRENSDKDFSVLPGIDYADNTGSRYVAFGDFNWPPEGVFSPDKKRIIQPTFFFNINVAPNGPYNISKNPLRPWDYSLYNIFSVYTIENNKVKDIAFGPYRYLQQIQDDPIPVVVNKIYKIKDIERAKENFSPYIMNDNVAKLTEYFRRHHYFGSYTFFVSNGPEVVDWRAINPSRWTGGKWFLPSTMTYRVKLTAFSDYPIKDIKIFDGTSLFLRFKPEKKNVNIIFDLPHDQQRNLLAEITDSEGRKAITGGIFVRDLLNFRFMCGDRGNSICDALQTDKYGPYLMGPSAPYQRKMTAFGIFPGYGTRHFNILPPYFDGGMRPFGMNVLPLISGLKIFPPESVAETKMGMPVCSRDGLLQEDNIVGYFPKITSSWAPKFKPVDIKDVEITYRYLDITPRAGDPGVILLTGRIKFKKEEKINSIVIYRSGKKTSTGDGDHFVLMTPNKKITGVVSDNPVSLSSEMVPGSYIMAYPCLWGSSGAIAIDKGYIAHLSARKPSINMRVSLSGFPRIVKKGETINYRLILYQGRYGEPPDNRDWENFVNKMGLRGKTGYNVEVKRGKIISKKFFLDFEPENYGIICKINRAKLPVRLPVFIRNLNSNWSAGYYNFENNQFFPFSIDTETNTGYFTIDTNTGNYRIFAGHPVISDKEELKIFVVKFDKKGIVAEVNNVSDKEIKAKVYLNPSIREEMKILTLKSGEFRKVNFQLK